MKVSKSAQGVKQAARRTFHRPSARKNSTPRTSFLRAGQSCNRSMPQIRVSSRNLSLLLRVEEDETAGDPLAKVHELGDVGRCVAGQFRLLRDFRISRGRAKLELRVGEEEIEVPETRK